MRARPAFGATSICEMQAGQGFDAPHQFSCKAAKLPPGDKTFTRQGFYRMKAFGSMMKFILPL
jgi:hypothetical protein